MQVSAVWLRFAAACAVVGLFSGLAGTHAQNMPGGAPGAVGVDNGARPIPDPVVAEVEGHAIHLSEVGDAIHAMPGGGGQNSFETLYPLALRRLIERAALVIRAQADGIADDPAVRRHMREAADEVLENAYLHHATAQGVTEQSLLARYDAEIRGKPGPEEVHAEVILLPTEAAARDVIARLAAGADFAALARQSSKDASSRTGGDLGFVRRDAVGPEIGAVLFSLRPGEVTPYPVRTASGWLVLRAVARTPGSTPSFAEARDRLEAESERDNVAPVLRAALSKLVVRAYDMNGREVAGAGEVPTDPASLH